MSRRPSLRLATQRQARPVAILVAAVVAALVALGTMSLVLRIGTAPRGSDLPPVVVGADAPDEVSDRLCPGLMTLMPKDLDGLSSRDVDSPSPYVSAWGDPAVVMRCGAPAPVELVPTSALLTVDDVAWFRRDGDSGVRWTAVDRDVYVDVTVPAGSTAQETVLVRLGRLVALALPETEGPVA